MDSMGKCAHCGKKVKLTKDGRVRRHKDASNRSRGNSWYGGCIGSGHPTGLEGLKSIKAELEGMIKWNEERGYKVEEGQREALKAIQKRLTEVTETTETTETTEPTETTVAEIMRRLSSETNISDELFNMVCSKLLNS